MSVVDFPTTPKTDPFDLVWCCTCGCESFELHGDGRTVCAHCGKVSTGADEDAMWFSKKPTPPAEGKDLPDQGTIKVQRIGSAAAARRNVLQSADSSQTVFVLVAFEDGITRCWASESWYDNPEPEWMENRFEACRNMLLKTSSLNQPELPLEVTPTNDFDPLGR